MRRNSTIANNTKCPSYFYQLLNQTIPFIMDYGSYSNHNEDKHNICEQTSHYKLLKRIGPYPAIYYFGKSFQSTILTMFFTLFGVIGEDDVPVNN